MKMFHLSSPLCGVPKGPEVTGDHDGHYLSDNRAVTVRELAKNGGKADWSAHQGYGGHRGHGEGPLCEVWNCPTNSLWWPREQQKVGRGAAL